MKKILNLIILIISMTACSFDDEKNKEFIAEEDFLGIEYTFNKNIENLSLEKSKDILLLKKENKIVLTKLNSGIKKGEFLFLLKEDLEIKNKKIVKELKSNSKRLISNQSFLGDFNFDGEVDIMDFSLFSRAYGGGESLFDISPAELGLGLWEGIYSSPTPDSKIDIYDFIVFGKNFGKLHPLKDENFQIDIKLEKTDLLLGEYIKLNADLIFENGEKNKQFYWTVENKEILEIKDGFLFALKEGQSKLSARYKGKEFSVNIKVSKEENFLFEKKHKEWALGEKILEFKSNDNKDYPWYFSQNNTGMHSKSNCGPTSVTMAIKWYNQNFDKTVQDARLTYRPNGGWWYTSDISNYLKLYNIPYEIKVISNNKEEIIKKEIDAGNLLILCLDMYYIKQNTSNNTEERIDKYYYNSSTGAGHFIVVTGYVRTEKGLFIEVNDPSSNTKYLDGTFKGDSRYYTYSDISKATEVWWNYIITIGREEKKSINHLEEEIIHMYGGN